jgi:CubicO group peptidase (beta-lactamase class C family)
MIKLISSVLLGCLFLSNPTVVIADQVDNYLQCEMKKLKIPGLSIAIVKNGQIMKTKGYGFSNIELQSPASSQTIYQSGSIGKQFTAMLAMILTEKGVLHLNDKINQYLIDAPESWKDITVFNLLNHTSGLTRYNLDVDLRLDYTHEEIVRRLRIYPLDFEPGTSFRYSNVAYELLGFIMEKVTGKSYNDLLQENIFKPLGMNTARVINDRDIIMNRAAGYDLVNGELKNQEYVSPTFNSTAEGAIYFTVLDLAKWDAALYTTKLLKKDNMELMWSPVKLKNGKSEHYGLGWRLDNINGQRIIEHGGEWQGFTAFISRYMDRKLTVIIMTNLSDNAELGAITHRVASIYDNEIKVAKDEESDNNCDATK